MRKQACKTLDWSKGMFELLQIYDQKYVVGGADFLIMPFSADRMLEI